MYEKFVASRSIYLFNYRVFIGILKREFSMRSILKTYNLLYIFIGLIAGTHQIGICQIYLQRVRIVKEE
jgi:hypothetical protein